MKIGYALPGVKLCGLPTKTCQTATDGWYKETCNSVLAVGNWDLAAKPRLCLTKYLSLYVRKYRQKCPQPCARLRRHMCRNLNGEPYLDLNLDLDLNLNPFLFLNSFQSLFRTFFASSLGSLFESMNA